VAKIITYGIGGFDSTKPNNNIISEVDEPDDLEPVPDVASPATIRVALRRLHGVTNTALDATVDAVLSQITDPGERDDAETLWLYSVSIRRDHPLVAAVGQVLNLTSDQVDEVFRVAETI
jgi:hypothetical protein